MILLCSGLRNAIVCELKKVTAKKVTHSDSRIETGNLSCVYVCPEIGRGGRGSPPAPLNAIFNRSPNGGVGERPSSARV